MTKDMTPMKKYSGGLNELRAVASEFFKEFSLNKSSPDYIPYNSRLRCQDSGYTKGVDSDFILIFKSKENSFSFALAFNYIGLEPEYQTVMASIKKGEDNSGIVASVPMPLDAFKNRLNEFNRSFRTEEKNSLVKLAQKFSEIFLEEKLDLDKEIKDASIILAKIIQDRQEAHQIELLTHLNQVNQKELENTQKAISTTIKEMAESRELKELQKRITELSAIINKKEKSLEKEYQLNKKTKAADNSRRTLNNAEHQVNQEVNIELKKLPKVVSNQIKPKF